MDDNETILDFTKKENPADKTLEFIRYKLPENLRNKSFYEIANYKDENGNTGISLIGDAVYQAIASARSDKRVSPEVRERLLNLASITSGSGYYNNQIQSMMTGFDKYGKALTSPNVEYPGLVFFSRPRLCLQSANLRSCPTMVTLDSSNPHNVSFAIRAMLDTNLSKAVPGSSFCKRYAAAIEECPLINEESPWLIPLTNTLKTFDGLPNLEVSTETTPGGYFNEAQTYALGGTNFNEGSYQVQCTFRELPGGIISALFYYWEEYIRLVTRGQMLAYADDIDRLIMNYTVSIYMFMMDPSMHRITRWVKCTGCFPKSLNIGSMFQKSEEIAPSQEAKTVNVTFSVNKVEYMRPECLLEFNMLAMRYCPEIDKCENRTGKKSWRDNTSVSNDFIKVLRPNIPFSSASNFCGLPFIESDERGYSLVFRSSRKDLFADQVVRGLINFDLTRLVNEWGHHADYMIGDSPVEKFNEESKVHNYIKNNRYMDFFEDTLNNRPLIMSLHEGLEHISDLMIKH